jgi:hypothetical protein
MINIGFSDKNTFDCGIESELLIRRSLDLRKDLSMPNTLSQK